MFSKFEFLNESVSNWNLADSYNTSTTEQL